MGLQNGEIQNSGVNVPPQSWLQHYRVAVQRAASAGNADEQINAYQQIVDYNRAVGGCPVDEGITCNQVMYWTYNSLGDTLIKKNWRIFKLRKNKPDYAQAINYYRQALAAARDNNEKSAVLQKMAKVYQLAGDREAWLRVQEAIIAQLPDERKSQAYYHLSGQYGTKPRGIFLLEKALDFTTREEVSVLVKCQNILTICDDLKNRYRQAQDFANQQRIEELSYRTAILMLSAIDGRLQREKDKEQRLKLYEKMLSVGSRYLTRDRMWRLRALQQMRREMQPGEVWRLNGKKYCHKIIDKKLQSF